MTAFALDPGRPPTGNGVYRPNCGWGPPIWTPEGRERVTHSPGLGRSTRPLRAPSSNVRWSGGSVPEEVDDERPCGVAPAVAP